MRLQIMSGGAVEGLVVALAPQFESETSCAVVGTFGAVGAMRDKLLAGSPADLVILTRPPIAELIRQGHILAGSAADIGVVRTAIAVRAGDSVPPVRDVAALRAALSAADDIYFPDPKLATAGIHFAKVLDALGLGAELATRLRPFPNGATAMRALAARKGGRALGCTQTTEILNTPGVTLAGPLPVQFELATVYTAGVSATSELPGLARQFAGLLAGSTARDIRTRLGFERA
ncbi:MAG: molybdate ABC transporter substrate-binding protein [Hyphomicrobiaceae bacterium]